MAPTRAEYLELAAEVDGVAAQARALSASVQPFKGWRSRAATESSADLVEGFVPMMTLVATLERFAVGVRSGQEPLPDPQQYAQMRASVRVLQQALAALEQGLREKLGPHGWKLPGPDARG
jgi:hypothetical protein